MLSMNITTPFGHLDDQSVPDDKGVRVRTHLKQPNGIGPDRSLVFPESSRNARLFEIFDSRCESRDSVNDFRSRTLYE